MWRRWCDFLRRLKAAVERDHLPITSAGVAFFLLLGIFPGLAGLYSIYGLLADPNQIESRLEAESGILPAEVHEILHAQVGEISGDLRAAAGWGSVLGIAFALWAGSRAMNGLIQGLNIVFSEAEKRGFISLQVASMVLTLAFVAVIICALLLIAVLPAAALLLPGDRIVPGTISLLRWPFLLAIVISLLALVYRFGPSRNKSASRWISPGAITVTLLWLAASALFSYYVDNFGAYDVTYGSLGAVAILMLWLYLTAFLILLGAEIDETLRHSGAGSPAPSGPDQDKNPT